RSDPLFRAATSWLCPVGPPEAAPSRIGGTADGIGIASLAGAPGPEGDDSSGAGAVAAELHRAHGLEVLPAGRCLRGADSVGGPPDDDDVLRAAGASALRAQ